MIGSFYLPRSAVRNSVPSPKPIAKAHHLQPNMPHHCAPCNSNFRNLDDLLWHLDNGHSTPPARKPEQRVSNWERYYEEPQRSWGLAHKRTDDEIDKFFARYPLYRYDRYAPFWQQFHKLCWAYRWPTTKAQREADKDPNSEQKLAWKAFRIAVVKSFGATFGTAEDDIDAWGRLCRVVGERSITNLDLKARRDV